MGLSLSVGMQMQVSCSGRYSVACIFNESCIPRTALCPCLSLSFAILSTLPLLHPTLSHQVFHLQNYLPVHYVARPSSGW